MMIEETSNNGRTLSLTGEISVCRAAELHGLCLQLTARGYEVAVDCAAAESIDVVGLQLLIALHDALAARGGSCRLVHVPEEVLKTIRLAGMSDRLGLDVAGETNASAAGARPLVAPNDLAATVPA